MSRMPFTRPHAGRAAAEIVHVAVCAALLAAGAAQAVPAPTVAITQPTDGAVVRGSLTVDIEALAAPGCRITRITLYAGNYPVGSGTSSPLSITLDTTQAADGQYILLATAQDDCNTTGSSNQVHITVDNHGDAGSAGSDAGSPQNDAGSPATDAGTSDTDAGSSGADAGISDTDAGSARGGSDGGTASGGHGSDAGTTGGPTSSNGSPPPSGSGLLTPIRAGCSVAFGAPALTGLFGLLALARLARRRRRPPYQR